MKFASAAVLTVLILLAGCTAGDLRDITLPSEEILLSRGRVALVVAEYARLFGQPDSTSPVRVVLRRGEIGDIVGSSAGQTIVRGDLDYWYEVDFSSAGLKGWVFGGDLELYATQAKAQNAAQNEVGSVRSD